MTEEIILDLLNKNGVSIKKQKYIVEDGIKYSAGKPWRRSYINSEEGRIQLQNELSEPYLSAVMIVWGDTPTIIEEEYI